MNPYSLMPDALAPTPASLPLPQARAWRPAGVDVPLPVSRDPFRPTVPLLGKGKAGAARLVVMALVVGAQGVGASYLAEHTFGGPDAANSDLAASAFVLTDEEIQLRAAEVEEASAQAEQARADAARRQTQRETSPSKAKAAFHQYRQAQLAAARVKAAQERREQALRNAQRDPKSAARLLVADRGWSSSEFSCLDSLWIKESNWNYQATNSSSGAYGIPQSLPGSKMASAGSDWQTNPVTQIRWGLDYIAERYGTPCGAWNFSQAHNSY
ncbi:hypothetical protein [Kineosporia sp. NBRC 101731]|uniref:aggregation-promoting factor C-terminal-like domain-containing protein n=1 Tax=Kineosporia sp. NBRC 101731 TaxID=3032199 RepID=UPI002553D931|nr:hypothetical protein [Kineosporia sp. NBRC 101731]